MKQKHIISLGDKIRPLNYHMLSLLLKKKKKTKNQKPSFETFDCRLSYKREGKFGTRTRPKWADSTLKSLTVKFLLGWCSLFILFSGRGPNHCPRKLAGKYSFMNIEIKRIFLYVLLKNVCADTKSKETLCTTDFTDYLFIK